MHPLKQRSFDPNSIEGEFNVVEMWSNPRKQRIIAGVLAGIVAGVCMLVFGFIYCAIKGIDITAPMKIGALPFLQVDALQIGSMKAIAVGLLAHFGLSSVLGALYAHFTGVNHRGALFGMGLTWGIFGWIFITNLFMPSFRAYHMAQIPSSVMIFAWIAFGLGLMSVSIFDKDGYKA